ERDALEAGEIVIGPLRAIHECCRHGGNQAASLDFFFFNQAKHFWRIELADHYMCSAYQRQRMRYTPAISVEKWDGVQFHRVRTRIEDNNHVEGMKINVAMR